LEAELRIAAGAIAQARTKCLEKADALRDCAEAFIHRAAKAADVKRELENAAAEEVAGIVSAIREVAGNAANVLAKAAAALEMDNLPEADELLEVLKNMPRFDLGSVASDIVSRFLGRRRIRSQAASELADALAIHARVMRAWVTATFADLQERFDSFAGAYRAQLDRVGASAA
jgi:hypothetical protein